MYLCHTLLYTGLKQMAGYDALSWWEKFFCKAAATALIVTISGVNYRFFEKPLTDLRDRLAGNRATVAP
jgi:peptidoglycan/LPS O-acetylase OafA/YrhL